MNTNDKDKIFDQNLQAIGRISPRSEEPSQDQVDRWTQLAKPQTRATILKIPMRSWLKTACSLAAAAMIVIAVLVGFQLADPGTLSARELSGMVDYTLSSKPVVRVSVKNIHHMGHNLNMEVYSSGADRQAYTKLTLAPEDARQILALDTSFSFGARKDSAWLLIDRFSYNSNDFLKGLDGGGKSAAIIRWPIDQAPFDIMNRQLPVVVEFRDIQAFVDSLQQAAPELRRKRLADGTVEFEGKLLYPEKLDLSSLEKSVNVLRLADSLSSEVLDNPDYELMMKLAKMVTQELFNSYQEFISIARQHQQITESFSDLVRNSTIQVAYDPDTKMVKRITLGQIGTSDGELSFDFEARGYRPEILDFQKTRDNANAREITRSQLLLTIIRGLLAQRGN